MELILLLLFFEMFIITKTVTNNPVNQKIDYFYNKYIFLKYNHKWLYIMVLAFTSVVSFTIMIAYQTPISIFGVLILMLFIYKEWRMYNFFLHLFKEEKVLDKKEFFSALILDYHHLEPQNPKDEVALSIISSSYVNTNWINIWQKEIILAIVVILAMLPYSYLYQM